MSKVSKQECKAQVNTAEIDITIYHSEHMIALPIRGEVTVFYRNTMQKKRVSWIAKTFKISLYKMFSVDRFFKISLI